MTETLRRLLYENLLRAPDGAEGGGGEEGGEEGAKPGAEGAEGAGEGGEGGEGDKGGKPAKKAKAEEKPAEPDPAELYAKLVEGVSDKKAKDYLKRFKGFEDLGVNSLKLRNELSTRLKIPGEDASEEDIAAYNKALGIPDKVDGYKVELPEDYELSEIDESFMEAMKAVALESKIPAASFGAFAKKYLEIKDQIEEQIATDVENAGKDAVAQLKKEFGAKEFDKLTKAGRTLVEATGGDELRDFLNNAVIQGLNIKVGDHPAVFKVFATLGKRMGEDGVITPMNQDERTSIQGKIDKIMSDHFGKPTYSDKRVQAELSELYQQLHGNAPIVGVAGRTT